MYCIILCCITSFVFLYLIILCCIVLCYTPSFDFFLIFVDTIFQFPKLLHKHGLLITNFHNITFLSTRVWQILSSPSIFSNVPLSLVAFRASVILSVSLYWNGLIPEGLPVLVFFVHVFLQIKPLVLILFTSQFCIISIFKCIIQLFFILYVWTFNALFWTEIILIESSLISSLV